MVIAASVDVGGHVLGLAESIDHMTCVEFRRTGPTVSSGVIDPLYRAARAQAQGPLAWSAASALGKLCVGPKTIFIATGHVHPVALPAGETDGPLGAVALARAVLEVGGAPVVLLSEAVVVPVLREVCRAAGLNVRDRAELPLPRSVAVEAFPNGDEHAKTVSSTLIQEAGAVIAIEKIGPCEGGGYRTGSGTRVDDSLAKIDVFVDLARESRILTIGIGDLGNEIGMANIASTVRQVVRTGRVIASEVPTDHLIVAGCSNWGAYALAASLAAQYGRLAAVHTGELEKYMLEAACRAGCVDGFSTAPNREVDGASLRTHVAWVDVLHDIVEIALNTATPDRHKIEGTLEKLEGAE